MAKKTDKKKAEEIKKMDEELLKTEAEEMTVEEQMEELAEKVQENQHGIEETNEPILEAETPEEQIARIISEHRDDYDIIHTENAEVADPATAVIIDPSLYYPQNRKIQKELRKQFQKAKGEKSEGGKKKSKKDSKEDKKKDKMKVPKNGETITFTKNGTETTKTEETPVVETGAPTTDGQNILKWCQNASVEEVEALLKMVKERDQIQKEVAKATGGNPATEEESKEDISKAIITIAEDKQTGTIHSAHFTQEYLNIRGEFDELRSSTQAIRDNVADTYKHFTYRKIHLAFLDSYVDWLKLVCLKTRDTKFLKVEMESLKKDAEILQNKDTDINKYLSNLKKLDVESINLPNDIEPDTVKDIAAKLMATHYRFVETAKEFPYGDGLPGKIIKMIDYATSMVQPASNAEEMEFNRKIFEAEGIAC